MSSPDLLCIDIGNTHVHLAVRRGGAFGLITEIPTAALDAPDGGLARLLAPALPVAFCSVVPAATGRLQSLASAHGVDAWQLTHDQDLGLPVNYPRPAEIGQDRLANAAGARDLLGAAPAVVIDLGTAVTFDIITAGGGYEGGIIAPGPALVTRYLHERTAQLPLVEDLMTPVTTTIGKSTVEAIRIGAVLGFVGLIQGLLDGVLAELAARGEPAPAIITSGGASAVIQGRLRQPIRDIPDLTLRGLAAAWALNRR
ncbi:MAG: type III pantothenate kinase [Verrucomicrobiota bacterium]